MKVSTNHPAIDGRTPLAHCACCGGSLRDAAGRTLHIEILIESQSIYFHSECFEGLAVALYLADGKATAPDIQHDARGIARRLANQIRE